MKSMLISIGQLYITNNREDRIIAKLSKGNLRKPSTQLAAELHENYRVVLKI